MYDLSSFHVAASVDEVDAVLVEVGQAVDVLVDAFPERVFDGTVKRVGVGPSASSGGGVVYPVDVQLDAEQGLAFRVGMTASVEIVVREVESDTVVPSRALLTRESREVVLVARDGHVEEVQIDVEALGEEDAAVDGDLRVGEEVVVAGFEDLADGDPLT